MANFTVKGPFDVRVTKKKAGRFIAKEGISEFWKSQSGIAQSYGCYVFAFRASKGLKPVYINQRQSKGS